MHQQYWIARWITPDGTAHEVIFPSMQERMIARIDFVLKLMDMDIPRPNEYELEEARSNLSSLPRPIHMQWQT